MGFDHGHVMSALEGDHRNEFTTTYKLLVEEKLLQAESEAEEPPQFGGGA
jgi:hypothetical protein